MENDNDIFNDDFLNDDDLTSEETENKSSQNDLHKSTDVFVPEKTEDKTPSQRETDFLTSFLESKGFKEGKIKILDEDNKESEVEFNTLSNEEKLDILNSLSTPKEVNINSGDVKLTDEERKIFQELRENNVTLDKYLEDYQKSLIQEQDQVYDIDSYDDEELYVLDLKTRFPDLSDDELVKELEKELENKEQFDKKTKSLRTEYKKLEDNYNEQQQQDFVKEQESMYQEFADQMVDTAIKNPEFYGIELEDSEKNDVLSYLLDLDDNGVSNFYKDLSDPEKIYRAAWFMKYGEEAFNAVRDAYETEITKIQEEGKDKKPDVVIKKKNDNENNEQSIFDIDF